MLKKVSIIKESRWPIINPKLIDLTPSTSADPEFEDDFIKFCVAIALYSLFLFNQTKID